MGRINAASFTLRYMHYSDIIMSTMASQITGLTIVYSTVYSGVTALCEGNSPVPTQRASNAGNVSIRWRNHVAFPYTVISTGLVLIISTINKVKCVLKPRCQHTKYINYPIVIVIPYLTYWCDIYSITITLTRWSFLKKKQGYMTQVSIVKTVPRLYGLTGLCSMGEI